MKRMLLPMLLLPAVASADLVMVDESAVQTAGSSPIPIVQIRPVPKPKEVWTGESGESLKTSVMKWAEKAKWNVIWDTTIDYPLLAPVSFEGRFDEAVAQFVRLYEGAEQPLVADIQSQQSLIYITNRRPGR